MKRRRVFSELSRLRAIQRRGVVYVALGVLVIAAGFGFGAAWRVTVAFAAGSFVVGVVQLGRARLCFARRRRAADALLRTGIVVHPQSELLRWRAAELTSEPNRKTLAGSLSRIVRELERPSLQTAVPLNRRGVRPHLALLRTLAGRLAELERPVEPQGIVLVEELLTNGATSPLYFGGRAEDVPTVVFRCLTALEGEFGSSIDKTSERFVSGLPRVSSGRGN